MQLYDGSEEAVAFVRRKDYGYCNTLVVRIVRPF
jgi:hypothetical protein